MVTICLACKGWILVPFMFHRSTQVTPVHFIHNWSNSIRQCCGSADNVQLYMPSVWCICLCVSTWVIIAEAQTELDVFKLSVAESEKVVAYLATHTSGIVKVDKKSITSRLYHDWNQQFIALSWGCFYKGNLSVADNVKHLTRSCFYKMC